jgi:hypothetical protein
MSLRTKKALTIPSRYDNPFATCWTRPGAIAFRFDDGQSAEALVARLASQNWTGAIVGPHGSGKSTLLESLKPALLRAGCQVRSIALRDHERRLPDDFWRECTSASGECRLLIIIDGFEQLGWLQRARVKRFCRRRRAGLLVTAHRPIRIRTLIELLPDFRLVNQLVGGLCANVSTAVTVEDVAASHASHGHNVREILFDLYRVHERMHPR